MLFYMVYKCYGWYKVINAEDIIENLKDDDLYGIDKRLKEILDEKKPIEAEINKLNRKLGKKGQQIIFNDSVVSEFSDIETNRVRRNENKSSDDDDDPFACSDSLEGIKDIASLFQY